MAKKIGIHLDEDAIDLLGTLAGPGYNKGKLVSQLIRDEAARRASGGQTAGAGGAQEAAYAAIGRQVVQLGLQLARVLPGEVTPEASPAATESE